MKLLAFLSLFLIVSCQNINDEHIKEIAQLKTELQSSKDKNKEILAAKPGFIHTVFFWIKKDANEKEINEFRKIAMPELTKCSSIQDVYYGPAAMTPREVVDNSYDMAWICHFKDKKAYEKYEVDPIHLAFIEKYNHLWDKVLVYDNMTN